MKRLLSILLIIASHLSASERTTDVYLSLTKKASSDAVYYSIPEIDVIDLSGKKNITDAVAESASVVVRQNTFNFGLSLPSIRGFSSNQTAVVYDGVKLPKDITSTYDLSILPDISSDKVFLIKGGWSSVFGANTEGGVIAIETQKPKSNLFESGFEFSSFDTERYFFKNSVVKENSSFLTSASIYESDGFQQNSYARKKSFSTNFYHNFKNYGTTKINLFAVDLKRGLPSGTPYDISKFNGEREKIANSTTDWQSDINLFGSVSHSFSVLDTESEITYSRSQLTRKAYQWSFLTSIKTYSNNILLRTKLSGFNLGCEYEENKLRSKVYGNHEMKTIGYYVNRGFSLSDKIDANIYLRYDDSKNFDNVLSPKAVLSYKISESLNSSYSVGRAWRAPNFVDLYGAPSLWYLANPDIKPEKAVSNEITLSYHKKVNASMTMYYYDINDKITIYTDPNTWQSKSVNMAEAYTKGVEFSFGYAFNIFSINAGANFIDVRGKNAGSGSYKKLAYSPSSKYIFSIYADTLLGGITFKTERVSEQWSGYNKTGKKIPTYTVSSVYFAKKIENLSLNFMIENIFNERYATTADSWNGYYPADPRRYSFSLSLMF